VAPIAFCLSPLRVRLRGSGGRAEVPEPAHTPLAISADRSGTCIRRVYIGGYSEAGSEQGRPGLARECNPYQGQRGSGLARFLAACFCNAEYRPGPLPVASGEPSGGTMHVHRDDQPKFTEVRGSGFL
jgi:hypothetical protein